MQGGAQQGLALSYYGDFLPSEDFGYVPEGGGESDSCDSRILDQMGRKRDGDPALARGEKSFVLGRRIAITIDRLTKHSKAPAATPR